MADLSDVTALLASLCAEACYPALNGAPAGTVASGNANSVTGACVSIREGWPIFKELIAEIEAGTTRVSIYPVPGATAQVYQILDKPYVQVPAAHNVTAAIADDAVTLTGAPSASEYVSLVVDGRRAYSRIAADDPPTLQSIVDQLAADVGQDFPGVSASGGTIAIPGATLIEARIGAPAVLAQVTHRQRHSVMVTVWASTPDKRARVSEAIDVLLKSRLKAALPDTSECVFRYEKTNVTDEFEGVSIFRRDLIYGVEYATIETFAGFQVTVFNGTVAPGDNPGMPIAQPIG